MGTSLTRARIVAVVAVAATAAVCVGPVAHALDVVGQPSNQPHLTGVSAPQPQQPLAVAKPQPQPQLNAAPAQPSGDLKVAAPQPNPPIQQPQQTPPQDPPAQPAQTPPSPQATATPQAAGATNPQAPASAAPVQDTTTVQQTPSAPTADIGQGGGGPAVSGDQLQGSSADPQGTATPDDASTAGASSSQPTSSPQGPAPAPPTAAPGSSQAPSTPIGVTSATSGPTHVLVTPTPSTTPLTVAHPTPTGSVPVTRYPSGHQLGTDAVQQTTSPQSTAPQATVQHTLPASDIPIYHGRPASEGEVPQPKNSSIGRVGWCLSAGYYELIGASARLCPWSPGSKGTVSVGAGLGVDLGVDYDADQAGPGGLDVAGTIGYSAGPASASAGLSRGLGSGDPWTASGDIGVGAGPASAGVHGDLSTDGQIGAAANAGPKISEQHTHGRTSHDRRRRGPAKKAHNGIGAGFGGHVDLEWNSP